MAERVNQATTEGSTLTDRQATQMISRAIAERRNQFIAEYVAGEHGSTALAYEPALDRGVYMVLNSFQEDYPTAYREARAALDAYTRFQVETHIGERLNVNISRFRYDLRDGVLYAQNTDEQILDMIQRGGEARRAITIPSDQERHAAEVTEFQEIQRVLGNADTPDGTIMLTVSPPGKDGSAYPHNFHDMFILKRDTNGERYIEARRYSSGLSPEQYLEEMRTIDPSYGADFDPRTMDLAVYFLSHPVEIASGTDPETLHQRLHQDQGIDVITEEDFRVVTREIRQMVDWYTRELARDPDNSDSLNTILDAITNKADDVADGLKKKAAGLRVAYEFGQALTEERMLAQLAFYGEQDVREVTTGCGASGSLGKKNRKPGNMGSFTLLDSIEQDEWGSLKVECPDCGRPHRRERGGWIFRCDGCGSTTIACGRKENE